MPLCDRCKSKQAVFYQRHTGKKLCKECFFEDVLQRVKKEVERHRMFSQNDKLLLALSGGKDSFVLLDVLVQIHSPSKMVALSIIEGIRGYNRPQDIERLRSIVRSYGIDHFVVSVKQYLGYSVDDFAEAQLKLYGKLRIPPCTYCGLARRRIMNVFAREIGASRVVTAHNLDDEAQTYIMNLLRGDPARIVQVHPQAPLLSRLFIRRVKPLRKIYEYETAAYAYLKGFHFQEVECPYLDMRPTLRARIRRFLYELEVNSPGALLKLVEFLDTILEPYVKKLKLPELPRCKRCGEPTSYGRDLCKLCELIEIVENAAKQNR